MLLEILCGVLVQATNAGRVSYSIVLVAALKTVTSMMHFPLQMMSESSI